MAAGAVLVPAAGAQTPSNDASLFSLSIESDIAQTRMFPAFDPAVERYDVAVPSGETEVTVKVKTNDPGASAVLESTRSGRCCIEELDYDANTDAYTLELRTDRYTHMTIKVTAEDGVTTKQYRVSVDIASNEAKGWRVYNDVPMDSLVVHMDSLVDEPQFPSHYIRGLWADDSRVLTTARRHGTKDGEFYLDQKLYAFDAADSSRLPDEEFVLSGGPSAGIWSDGTTLWALETDGTLRAYNLSDGSEITGWSVDLSPDGYYDTREVYEPRGIWSDGDTLWVTGKDDADNAKGFAFELPKGCNSCRKSSLDFELSGDNDNPWGITGNADTWWVTEVGEGGWTADTRKIYAYNRSDGSRDTDKDIDLLQLTTTHLQQLYYGLAATDTIMYVAEYITGRVYSFSMPGVSGPVAPALTSSDATLSGLSLNNASLSPGFSSSQTRYEANVEPDVTSTTVTATPNHPSARAVVKLDGVIAANGVVGPLVVGINTIIVEVTAQDGFKQTYTVEVGRRAKSTDATLADLDLTDVTLNFQSGTDTYTPLAVANSVASTAVTPTLSDSRASYVVQLDGVDDDGDDVVDLAVGTNVITVVVTAEDGTTKTYTVTVTRNRVLSDNAMLNDLVLMYGEEEADLTPGFAVDEYSYITSLAHGVTSVLVKFEKGDTNQTVALKAGGAKDENGDVADESPLTIVSGGTTLNLDVDVNTLTVDVTAENGIATQSYEVSITREAASNVATLESLSLEPGTINETFQSGTVLYSASVLHDEDSTVVKYVKSDDTATVLVKVGGTVGQNNQVTFGTDADTDGSVDLVVDSNTVTVEVTAQDGQTKNLYVVTVTRPVEPSSTDATLGALELTNPKNSLAVDLDSAFSASDTYYAAAVGNDVTQVVVVAKPTDSDAESVQLQVDGADPGNDPANGDKTALADGVTVDLGEPNVATVLTIKVTAEDGNATATYTVVVTRSLPPLRGVMTLDNLVLRDLSQTVMTLTPVFAQDETEYRMSVDHGVTKLEVIPSLTDADGATVEITDADPGGFVPLDVVGENVITVVVTAQNGTATATYTVTVTRGAAPAVDDATLSSLTLSVKDIGFTSGTDSYAVSVVNGVDEATVSAVAKSANAEVTTTLGDTTATADASVSLDVPLAVGANEITVVVTAEDDTATKTYTVTVNRAQPTPSGNTGGGNSNRPGTNTGGGFSTPIGGSNTEPDDTETAQDESDTVTPLDDVGDADADHQADINELHGLGVFVGTLCEANSLCPNDPTARWIAAVWLVRLIDGDDPAPVTESRFADVHVSTMWEDAVWYAPHVERLAELEITVGCSEDPLRFCPDVMLSKAQVASWIARAFDLDSASSQGFVDAVGSVHEANINAAVAAGVMEGCSTDPKNFCPDDTVTRGEMANYVNKARKAASN